MRIIFLLMILSLSPVSYGAIGVEKIYTRLTGKMLTFKNPLYKDLKQLESQGKIADAASMIMDKDSDFIDTVSKDWATRMLNVDENSYAPFTDMVATVLGTIRDGIDGREILTGDYIYAPNKRMSAGITHSLNNNQVSESFEARNLSASKYIEKFSPQWNSSYAHSAAGVLTTRGWGQVYYDAGTNRRAVVGVFNAFMCTPIDEWKKRGLPDFRVRRDIDRAPEGKPSTFQNTCRTCHSAMDGMAGAFSRLDFKNNTLVFSPNVVPKYNQHTEVYPDGFITDDDSWINFLTEEDSNGFGWQGPNEGFGVKEFAETLANSEGFKSCMAKRVIKQICGKELALKDAEVIKMGNAFSKSGFKFKELFKEVVTSENCYL